MFPSKQDVTEYVYERGESIIDLESTDKKFVAVPGIINCLALFIIPENGTQMYVTHISPSMAQGDYGEVPFGEKSFQFIDNHRDQKLSVVVFDERGWFSRIQHTLRAILEGKSVRSEFVISQPKILGPIVNDKLTSCYKYDIEAKLFYLKQKNITCLGTLERLRKRVQAGSIRDLPDQNFLEKFNAVYRPGLFGMIGPGYFGRHEKTRMAILKRKIDHPESATGKAAMTMQLNMGS